MRGRSRVNGRCLCRRLHDISLCAGLHGGIGRAGFRLPKPDHPVADIVSPIWHDEKEHHDDGEPRQLVRLLGINSGMTIADCRPRPYVFPIFVQGFYIS